MGLKELMGDSYKQDLTVEEIENFFSANEKIVNLANGGYVSKGKFDDVEKKLKELTNNTKDYEELKAKYGELTEKVEKDGKLSTIKKYVKDEFVDYVYFQLKNENLLDDKLEENVKGYVSKNKQYSSAVKKETPVKIISSATNLDSQRVSKENPNKSFNDLIRKSAGLSVENN